MKLALLFGTILLLGGGVLAGPDEPRHRAKRVPVDQTVPLVSSSSPRSVPDPTNLEIPEPGATNLTLPTGHLNE